MSELFLLGLSHRTAPLDLREAVALTEGRAAGAMSELIADAAIREVTTVSTCNRTEIYLVVDDPVRAESLALSVLSRQAGIGPTGLAPHLYSMAGSQAARHLFRVAAGLESMIVGEAEIQGQVRRAHELALVEGGSGPVLTRLFHGALTAGGRVREETGISRKGVSVPSVSIELAEQAIGDLRGRRVVVVGTGDTAALVGRALSARGASMVFVASRHFDKAVGLASRFGGEAARLDELSTHLVEAEVVVSATNSPHYVVEVEDLAFREGASDPRQLLLIDLAVPRDISPACRDEQGVILHDIDDVQRQVERNSGVREAESHEGGLILDAELARFEQWLAALEVLPTVAALRGFADDVVERVLAENSSRWQDLSEADRARVEAMAHAIAGRMLHAPTMRLREIAGSDRAYESVNTLRELFALDVDTVPEVETDATVTPIRGRSAG
ncbi:MAG: glutamyl-tRNA reductase [Solirubrobacterales bacterium]